MNPRNELGLAHYRLHSDLGERGLTDILKENDAGHLELHLEDLELAARFSREFSISLHIPPWLDIWREGEAGSWLRKNFTSIARVMKNPVLVWHPAISSPGETSKAVRSRLFSDSVAFFRLARELAPRNFVLCLENLTHGMSRMRIGDTVEELVELRQAIDHEDVKFCWDIGHHIMGLRHLEERPIPEEFLDNVSMVHLHGVEGMDRPREKWWDHYPLTANSVPWEKYVRLLFDHGYEGPMVLEVFRGLEEDPIHRREQLAQSFTIVKDCLRRAP